MVSVLHRTLGSVDLVAEGTRLWLGAMLRSTPGQDLEEKHKNSLSFLGLFRVCITRA